MRAWFATTVRAVKLVISDGRIPRPIRWGGALGLLPIPGPFDEVVLLFVGAILWLFYRESLKEAWLVAATRTRSGRSSRLGTIEQPPQ